MNSPAAVLAAPVLLALWLGAQAGAGPRAVPPAAETGTFGLVRALADDVESIAARTRPRHWPLRHACLYYALAGQDLLARHGIATKLRIGSIDYRPGTALHHPISPHVWLVTETHFIDYAALPRWGRVEIIPRALVAETAGQVRPGTTRVRAEAVRPDGALASFLRHHERRLRLLLGSGHAPR